MNGITETAQAVEQLPIVDPHLHLWQLSHGHYHWLRQHNPPYWPEKNLLQQDFLPEDLQLTAPFQLAGLVHIEAGFDNARPERELAWLRRLQFSCPYRAVAFLDCAQPLPAIETALQALLAYQPVGVRHIFEGTDQHLLQQPQMLQIARLLQQHQLLLEVQCELASIANVNAIEQLAQRYPELKLVLNHAGLVQNAQWLAWQSAIKQLAAYPNIALKLSGWELQRAGESTEADPDWQRRVLSELLHYWPGSRLMLASNFPLCLWQGSYQQLWQRYHQLCQNEGLSGDDWRQLSGETAAHWYQLAEAVR
ncbi:amidohydrolase family protein [Arsukibacterium sp.]|uniref:amidohydrolase family protein n=1 Tax=Arsukibacterium sp. TaxID=1977258 RepID=UPI002FD94AEC